MALNFPFVMTPYPPAAKLSKATGEVDIVHGHHHVGHIGLKVARNDCLKSKDRIGTDHVPETVEHMLYTHRSIVTATHENTHHQLRVIPLIVGSEQPPIELNAGLRTGISTRGHNAGYGA
jgi:hypothetical protein